MLALMDLAAASAGPWLVLGVVVGLLLAGMLALAVTSVRRTPPSAQAVPASPDTETPPEPVDGWTEDDLPGFLDQPPGTVPHQEAAPTQADTPLAAPESSAAPVRRRVPAHAATAGPAAPDPGRFLLVLSTVALLLVGAAAALAALTDPAASKAATAASADASPAWDVPDLPAVPDQPAPGDPGAGLLAATSVPVGDRGALARLTFEGLVLERRAVGVTAAYPSVSVTAADLSGGPALAHVRLPVWNCLTDAAPDDPVAAGCRRLPTEYAELPTPALAISEDSDGLRISGRFPTYVRPSGSPPAWTGRVYPLTVHVQPDGDDATGTLHLGTDRAASVDDPLLSDFRRGG
jgi:hypothetical protein